MRILELTTLKKTVIVIDKGLVALKDYVNAIKVLKGLIAKFQPSIIYS